MTKETEAEEHFTRTLRNKLKAAAVPLLLVAGFAIVVVLIVFGVFYQSSSPSPSPGGCPKENFPADVQRWIDAQGGEIQLSSSTAGGSFEWECSADGHWEPAVSTP